MWKTRIKLVFLPRPNFNSFKAPISTKALKGINYAITLDNSVKGHIEFSAVLRFFGFETATH